MTVAQPTIRRPKNAGFTLLEVVIALAILAIGLAVLLESQGASLLAAGKARDITIGTLLARSKLVDVEQQLFDDGFTSGDDEEEGDFSEEGFPHIRWKTSVSEVEFDLSALTALCGAYGGEDGEGGADCEATLGAVGGPLEGMGLIDEIGQSLRAVEVVVTWPEGKYEDSVSVRALMGREDFGIGPAGGAGGDAGAGTQSRQGGAGVPGGLR